MKTGWKIFFTWMGIVTTSTIIYYLIQSSVEKKKIEYETEALKYSRNDE